METLTTAIQTLTDSQWRNLSVVAAEACRLDAQESEDLFQSRTGRLIGSLPFLAGCDQAERTALSHLWIYLLGSRGPGRATFDHTPEDDVDVHRRLASLGDFQGGDRRILTRGRNLLALQMLSGYLRDQAKDLVTGEYNPFLEGAWDARRMVDHLVHEIQLVDCPEMDGVMSVHDAQAVWWFK